MIDLTKLSSKTMTFISTLSVGGKSKRRCTSLAIAKVLAYNAILPLDKVTDLSNYFNLTLKVELSDKLFEINELVPIDIDAILTLTYNLYTYRYNQLHTDDVFTLVGKTTPVEDFFGITLSVNIDDLNTIKDNPLEIVSVVLGFKQLLTECSNMEY